MQGVADSMRALALVALAASAIVPLHPTEPLGYYELASGKTGPDLRQALHGITQSRHTVVRYDSIAKIDTVDALQVLDQAPDNANSVLLLYAERAEATTNYPTAWNREHMWPESYGVADGAKAPAHRLVPV